MSNHFMYKLTDMLTLLNAFEQLDSTMTLAKFNEIVKAGSNIMKGSYEGVLDGLRKTLQGSAIGATAIGDDSDSAPSRVEYQTNMMNLVKPDAQDNPPGIFATLKNKVQIVAAPTSGATAKTDFGALLSLIYLTPFALRATDNSLLSAGQADLYDKWNADKNLSAEGRAKGIANFSDMYLQDRAAMLAWRNKFNTEDKPDLSTLDAPVDQRIGASATNQEAALARIAGHF